MLIASFGGGVIGNTTGSGPVFGGSSPPPRAQAHTKPRWCRRPNTPPSQGGDHGFESRTGCSPFSPCEFGPASPCDTLLPVRGNGMSHESSVGSARRRCSATPWSSSEGNTGHGVELGSESLQRLSRTRMQRFPRDRAGVFPEHVSNDCGRAAQRVRSSRARVARGGDGAACRGVFGGRTLRPRSDSRSGAGDSGRAEARSASLRASSFTRDTNRAAPMLRNVAAACW